LFIPSSVNFYLART